MSSLPDDFGSSKKQKTSEPTTASQPITFNELFKPNVQSANSRFEDEKSRYIQELLELLKSPEKELDQNSKYYYFIGRLNPPHDGHIEALLNVIQMAIPNNGKAIILLGSGPNQGARTPKDPLDFDLKSKFVIDKLKDRLKEIYEEAYVEQLFLPNGKVEIMEMGRPVNQIQEAIQRDIEEKREKREKINFISNLISEIFAYRISGDKEGGEDLKKLEWIENGLKKAGIKNRDGSSIIITTGVIAQPAVIKEGTEMSATIIRNIIYDNSFPKLPEMSPEEFDFFRDQTKNFYYTSSKDYTRPIANAIYNYKSNKRGEVTEAEIIIKPKSTKLTKSTKNTKKGGSRRRTNRRRSRKTNKRRRRRTNKRRRN
jgi:nicotinamide mononucleotide adenylyltransferase